MEALLMEDYIQITEKIDDLTDEVKIINSIFTVLFNDYFSFDKIDPHSENSQVRENTDILCNAYKYWDTLLRVAYDKSSELQEEMCDLSHQIFHNKPLTEFRKKAGSSID